MLRDKRRVGLLFAAIQDRGKEAVVREAEHVEEGCQEGSLGDSQISGGVNRSNRREKDMHGEEDWEQDDCGTFPLKQLQKCLDITCALWFKEMIWGLSADGWRPHVGEKEQERDRGQHQQ